MLTIFRKTTQNAYFIHHKNTEDLDTDPYGIYRDSPSFGSSSHTIADTIPQDA